MAVVTVTGTIEITLPSENTEEIDVFMKKYEHLTPYLFNEDDYLGYNCIEIDSSTDEKDTTLLSIISDNIESCGFGFGHRAEPLPKLFYSDLFNLIKDSGEHYFTTIKASVFAYSEHYSASGKLTKDGIKWDVDDLEEESKSDQEEYEDELMNSDSQVKLNKQQLIDLEFIANYSEFFEVLQGFTDEGHEIVQVDYVDIRQYKIFAITNVALDTGSLPKDKYEWWCSEPDGLILSYLKHLVGNISNDSFYSKEKDYLERVKHISINKD
ncbi:MAG: hypothetical protein ACKVK1_03150 [Flavobacteriales bacterium]